MLKTVVDVKGLQKLEQAIQEKLALAVENTAEQMVSEAKARVRVRTGALRDSYEAVQLGPMHWEVHDGVPYGVHVNYGTRHMAADGHFSQAFENAKPVLEHRVARAMIEAGEEVER